jgi:hypothetical protein
MSITHSEAQSVEGDLSDAERGALQERISGAITDVRNLLVEVLPDGSVILRGQCNAYYFKLQAQRAVMSLVDCDLKNEIQVV